MDVITYPCLNSYAWLTNLFSVVPNRCLSESLNYLIAKHLTWPCWLFRYHHMMIEIDGFVQERHKSIANALEWCLSCTNPLKMKIQWYQSIRSNQYQACLFTVMTDICFVDDYDDYYGANCVTTSYKRWALQSTISPNNWNHEIITISISQNTTYMCFKII